MSDKMPIHCLRDINTSLLTLFWPDFYFFSDYFIFIPTADVRSAVNYSHLYFMDLMKVSVARYVL
jgi:hypothetical protein